MMKKFTNAIHWSLVISFSPFWLYIFGIQKAEFYGEISGILFLFVVILPMIGILLILFEVVYCGWVYISGMFRGIPIRDRLKAILPAFLALLFVVVTLYLKEQFVPGKYFDAL